MRKNLCLVMLLTIGSLFITSCGHYNLKYKPEIGKVYPMKMTADMNITQVIMEQEIVVKQKMVFGYTFEVEEKDADNNFFVETINHNIEMESEIMGKHLYYNSEDPESSNNPMYESLSTILKKPYKMKISENGEILDITGMDELFSELYDSLATEELKLQLKEQFSEEGFKASFANLFDIYPDEEVNIGDTWTNEALVKKPFEMLNKSKYTLLSVSNDTAYIEINTELIMAPDSEGLKVNGMELQVILNGTQKGTMLMDIKTGEVIKSHALQEISGQMKMKGATDQDKTMAWPIKVESEIIFEPFDL